ncbi:MAG: HAMP domain-containing protein [Planctomycetes bacterium]|nr:HAMP domain-containing protein [Planctomycetota bacterium]
MQIRRHRFRATLGFKILAVCATLVALAVGTLAYLFNGVGRASESIAREGVQFEHLQTVTDLKASFDAFNNSMTAYCLSWQRDPLDAAEAQAVEIENGLTALEAFDSAACNDLRESKARIQRVMSEAADTYMDENRVRGNALASEGLIAVAESSAILDRLAEEARAKMQTSAREVLAANDGLRVSAIYSMIGLAAVGGVLAWCFSRMLTSAIGRLARGLAALGRGELGHQVDVQSSDEVGAMAGELRRTQAVIGELIRESSRLIEGAREGRLDVRADAGRFEGSYRELCAGMNGMLEAVEGPVKESAAVLARLASGDLTEPASGKHAGEFDRMTSSVNATIQVLRRLLEQMNLLIQATAEGRLETRVDATQFRGSFRALVDQVNRMLDGVAAPLHQASDVLAHVAKGDLSKRLDGEYRGDYRRIQAHVNATVQVLSDLLSEFEQLVGGFDAGQLSLRARDERFEGSYRELCAKVNAMLVGILAPIDESRSVLQSLAHGDLSVMVTGAYAGDHAAVKRSLEETIAVLRSLLDETNQLIRACRDGKLEQRIDARRFEGAYSDLCSQINAMLDEVVAPMSEASSVLFKVAERDLTVRVEGQYAGDHAAVKRALNQAVEKMQTAIQGIGLDAQRLSAASSGLSTMSAEMEGKAAAGASKVAEVSAASEQISQRIQATAAAAEQMDAAIREIAARTTDASRIASAAVESVKETNTIMARLGESSTEIEGVIKLITSIAAQTNLLALNATIEAARAGDMGKGFAVVANEVKELANQTARATEEIANKIARIQIDTRSSVQSMSRIQAVIEEINGIQNSIAGAVEEQSATTKEITRNVADVARGATGIAESITDIASVAQAASSNATNVGATASEVTRMAEGLSELVESFHYADCGGTSAGARKLVGAR